MNTRNRLTVIGICCIVIDFIDRLHGCKVNDNLVILAIIIFAFAQLFPFNITINNTHIHRKE